jgi:DNA-binding MarR family transcriptional regulator
MGLLRSTADRIDRLRDMSPNRKDAPWLDGGQQRAWLAYIRVQLRLSYEINRQLQTDNDLSMPDYDVLSALANAPGERMQVTALANQIGWERSRTSHHVRRMAARGLVDARTSTTDRRATEVTLITPGRELLEKAAPGHVELVRNLFFAGLPPELLTPLTQAMESIYANILECGTLPPP